MNVNLKESGFVADLTAGLCYMGQPVRGEVCWPVFDDAISSHYFGEDCFTELGREIEEVAFCCVGLGNVGNRRLL
jgi:hypothetical protein